MVGLQGLFIIGHNRHHQCPLLAKVMRDLIHAMTVSSDGGDI